jgi:hypothetical protein
MVGQYKNETGKEMMGQTIWEIGIKAHKFIQKALSLIQKLDFISIDRTRWMTRLASSWTLQQFYQAIDNGMFVMMYQQNAATPAPGILKNPPLFPLHQII